MVESNDQRGIDRTLNFGWNFQITSYLQSCMWQGDTLIQRVVLPGWGSFIVPGCVQPFRKKFLLLRVVDDCIFVILWKAVRNKIKPQVETIWVWRGSCGHLKSETEQKTRNSSKRFCIVHIIPKVLPNTGMVHSQDHS